MSDQKISQHRGVHRKFLRLLGFHVQQIPPELGDAEQIVTIELLSENVQERFFTRFTGVCPLEVENLHPGCLCYLEIDYVANDQLEGLRYRVFSQEQDLTIRFYRNDFEFERSPLTAEDLSR